MQHFHELRWETTATSDRRAKEKNGNAHYLRAGILHRLPKNKGVWYSGGLHRRSLMPSLSDLVVLAEMPTCRLHE